MRVRCTETDRQTDRLGFGTVHHMVGGGEGDRCRRDEKNRRKRRAEDKRTTAYRCPRTGFGAERNRKFSGDDARSAKRGGRFPFTCNAVAARQSNEKLYLINDTHVVVSNRSRRISEISDDRMRVVAARTRGL